MWVKRNGFSLKTVTALWWGGEGGGLGGGKDIDRGGAVADRREKNH